MLSINSREGGKSRDRCVVSEFSSLFPSQVRGWQKKTFFVNSNGYIPRVKLVTPIYDIEAGCYYCVERIETYGSFKPLMAPEFSRVEHASCQGMFNAVIRGISFCE